MNEERKLSNPKRRRPRLIILKMNVPSSWLTCDPSLVEPACDVVVNLSPGVDIVERNKETNDKGYVLRIPSVSQPLLPKSDRKKRKNGV